MPRSDQHLQQAKLPFTVGFRYLEEGIRIRNQWHPVLKMQWVEGFTLNHFIRENLDKPNLLEALLQIWVRMAKRLREADLAHADLQHGNVLLVPGNTASSLSVKLIDYDGMWVPALAGQKSGEVGHPGVSAHQAAVRGHLLERGRSLSAASGGGRHCAACGVGGKPLWDRFDNGDNLLFREAGPGGAGAFRLCSQSWRRWRTRRRSGWCRRCGGRRANRWSRRRCWRRCCPRHLPAKKPAVVMPAAPASAKTKPAAKADIQSEAEPGRRPSRTWGPRRRARRHRPNRAGRRDKRASGCARVEEVGRSSVAARGAALLALILVLVLSGGQKDKPSDKPDDRQASNRDDSKKNKDDSGSPKKTEKPEKKESKDAAELKDKDKPVDPPARQLALKVPLLMRMGPGTFGVASIGLQGGKGADTQVYLKGMPPGVSGRPGRDQF